MDDRPRQPDGSDAARIAARGADVLRVEAAALLQMADAMPDGFADAVRLIMSAEGRVVLSGMGKSGHVARKIASTFASTGTPAMFVHPAEASHGDLGMITGSDVCMLLSNSGETRELHDLVTYTRRFTIPMIAMSKRRDSTLVHQSDVALILPDAAEACSIGMAPTTSTTCSMALGDALAVTIMRQRGFERDAFHVYHPGGKLGAQFLRVSAIMHTGERLPVVREATPMGEVLVVMTARSFGVAALVEGGILCGVITDGDLRRNLEGLVGKTAGEVATRTPRTVGPDALVSEALSLMNRHKISALFVVDEARRLIGLLHIHDCLRAGVV